MSGHSDENRSELRRAMDAMFKKDMRLVTAESLTCGGIGAKIVEMPRVSDVITGGFSVYNDDMKINMLNVPRAVIDRFSAISAEVAHYMAIGAIEKTFDCGDRSANIGVAVTGYAGSPNGFADEAESGKVYIAIATCFGEKARSSIDVNVYEHRFSGTRVEVQQKTIDQGVHYLFEMACNERVVPTDILAVHRVAPEKQHQTQGALRLVVNQ